MTHQPDFKTIAAKLINADPLSYKAYPDGFLVVISPTGQKFSFSPDQIQEVSHSIKPEPPPEPKTRAEPEQKPQPKRGRPSKSKQKS